MKAVVLKQHGSPEVLEFIENFPEPELSSNEVLVNVKFTSLNRVDLHIRKGYPGLNLRFPHILGGDIAGTVVKVGSNVINLKEGDKVVSYPVVIPEKTNPKFTGTEQLNDNWKFFGMHLNGSYAQFVSVPANNLEKLDSETKFEHACTLPVAGLTAYHSVVKVGNIQEGDIFFFWGGASGMGSFVIQLAKLAGAKVVTTVGNNAKREKVIEIGADYVFNHNTDDVVSEVNKLFPFGVDVILDYVGSATFDRSLAMLRKNGKLIVCGMMSSPEVNLNLQKFYIRHLNLLGIYLGSPDEFKKLVNLLNQKKITPLIDKIFDLKDASVAHKYMESGQHIGKILISID
ncbi:MAG: zinc-binding dehydrogenase [Ignavibacteria bacterium]|nr:zinc-binding dehydrogenase [Ignavibacteria bacterium]